MSLRDRPFHRVKDRITDRTVGIHTKASWTSVGMPTIRPKMSLSRVERRRTLRATPVPGLCPPARPGSVAGCCGALLWLLMCSSLGQNGSWVGPPPDWAHTCQVPEESRERFLRPASGDYSAA